MAPRHPLALTFALAALLLPMAGQAQAKIATVDINQVLNQSKEAQKMRKDLDQLSKDAKAKIEAKRKTLQQTEKKFKDNNTSENSEEVQKFRNELRNFERYVKDTEDDLKQKFLQNNRALAEAALKKIREYAKSNGLDLVLDRSSGVKGPVLYGSPSVDITEQIIGQLDE